MKALGKGKHGDLSFFLTSLTHIRTQQCSEPLATSFFDSAPNTAFLTAAASRPRWTPRSDRRWNRWYVADASELPGHFSSVEVRCCHPPARRGRRSRRARGNHPPTAATGSGLPAERYWNACGHSKAATLPAVGPAGPACAGAPPTWLVLGCPGPCCCCPHRSHSSASL